MQERGTPAHWTIYDIAREASVTAKTVSRVINNKSGVSAETRKRVLDIISRVDYHPHIGARALRGKTNACVGVTVSAPMTTVPINQNFFLWLFDELYRIFGVHGEYVCFDLNPFAQEHGDYARGMLEQLYKACVVAGPLSLEDAAIERIHASGIPYMAMGRLDRLPEISAATVDYEEGAYLSTRFLIERGHKRIAMLRAFDGFQPGLERQRGYLRALEEAGIAPDESLMRSVTFGARNIANMVHRLLVDPRVTALVDSSATEDASSLREGMRRAGRTVGNDLDVVAWTYAENGVVLEEAAAHLWLPVRESAAEGFEQLAAWMRGARQEPVHIVYRPVLQAVVSGQPVPRPKRLFEMLE